MRIERLNPEDRLMLTASRRWPQEIGALAILDGTTLLDEAGRLRIELIRQVVSERLHLVPRFRQRLHVPARWLGGPLWVDVPTIQLKRHVRVRKLPAGTTQSELLVATEQLRQRPLDPARPLWELSFMTGLPDGRVALFLKLHHAVADGLAAMTLLQMFFDAAPGGLVAAEPFRARRAVPSTAQLLYDVLGQQVKGLAGGLSLLLRPRAVARQLRAELPAIRELVAEEPASRTSLDRIVGSQRRLALVRASNAELRAIARSHHATVNDVLLAVTAGGLRTLLQDRGEPVDAITVRIFVPVTLRPRLRRLMQGNEIAQMVVPVPLAESDPVRRLRAIATETRRRKARARTSLGLLFGGGLIQRLMLMAVIRQRANVTTASLPGPIHPRYLAGARVLELFPFVPLIGNVTLGVGQISYAGALGIGVVADADTYPELNRFTAGVRADLRALRRTAGKRSVMGVGDAA